MNDVNYAKIANMVRDYFRTVSEFDKESTIAGLSFIEDFIVTGSEKEWPMLDENFPEVLRALALFLEETIRAKQDRS